jgi:LmbE family N-acetylglucosaminyl deacetylase
MDSKNLVVLGICAHPDDLDATAGGTFAKWAKEGAKCYYLICTNGSRGSADPSIPRNELIEIRKKEQKNAANILGVKDVYFLNNNDTELVADKKLKLDIIKYIRKIKPDIVVTTDPTFIYSKFGYINHSDHRAAGLATIDAIYPLAHNAYPFEEFEEDLKPHRVKMLYLINMSEPNEIIDISETVDLKIKALAEHKTQGLGRNPGDMKKLSQMIGNRHGFKYAESFVKINLERKPIDNL